MHVPLSPLRFLARAEAVYGDAAAIVCGETQWTYAAYAQRVRWLATALRDRLSLQPGQRLVYLGMNCHRLLELYYAVPALQAILVPLNIRLAPAEIGAILADCDPDVVVVSPELLPTVAALRSAGSSLPSRIRWLLTQEALTLGTGSVSVPEGFFAYERLIQGQAEPDASASPFGGGTGAVSLELPAHFDEETVCELFYTSGTTGSPRGVMLSHRAIYLHALTTALAIGLTERDRMVVGTVPLFHVNAWGIPQFMVAVAGIQIVVPRFDPETFCRAVERERATHAVMVPSMLGALLAFPHLADYDLSSLQELVLGGAPPVPQWVDRAEETLGIHCRVGYGLTETCPVVSVSNVKRTLDGLPPEKRRLYAEKTGLPVIGVEVRVVRADGSDVSQNGVEMGEILVRGDSVMTGYWHRPEETKAAIRDGYLYTGDLAVRDSDGYIDIMDRKKDILISGGENIASVQVEDALYSHPAVLEAAVVGESNPTWGEVPVAFVALRPGAQVSEADLLDHVRSRLARFKVPHRILLRDELPKTGTGKIMKAALRRELNDPPGKDSPQAAPGSQASP